MESSNGSCRTNPISHHVCNKLFHASLSLSVAPVTTYPSYRLPTLTSTSANGFHALVNFLIYAISSIIYDK